MISVAEAKALVDGSTQTLPPLCLPLLEAVNHVLAADVLATIDIPAFRQSSMDGYAFCFADRDGPLLIKGEMAAGTPDNVSIEGGEAMRIFTGAPLPDGADTVVMQEKVLVENGMLTLMDDGLQLGSNVRPIGSEASAGSIAMAQGNVLTPAAIGFLAGIGETRVMVFPMPSVRIIVTGTELQVPGVPLSAGQVYESNSFSLRAALQQAGISNVEADHATDDLQVLTATLAKALVRCDVVLLTGGVSVGDYDFVIEATRACAVQQVFHKVRQRPGKPLYFGTKGSKLVFGLPGNPSSVLSCFYHYVLPALGKLSGRITGMQQRDAELTAAINKPKALTTFLKGRYQNGTATPLGAQESFRLSSFAQANCLIGVEEGRSNVAAGEMVSVYLLPGID